MRHPGQRTPQFAGDDRALLRRREHIRSNTNKTAQLGLLLVPGDANDRPRSRRCSCPQAIFNKHNDGSY
jgi:hypothetical protein